MSDNGGLVEIIFLAMLAGFIALRLYSVLGRRTGHENPLGEGTGRPSIRMSDFEGKTGDAAFDSRPVLPEGLNPELRAPLMAIMQADPGFDPARFVAGARAAYGMILEAFWTGDIKTLEDYASDDVALQFRHAIDQRTADGLRLENKLVRIDHAEIVSAQLSGSMAEVTVRFDADLIAITRNSAGQIVAGSTSDAIATHDIWTFSRHVGSSDPNWLLIATDAQD